MVGLGLPINLEYAWRHAKPIKIVSSNQTSQIAKCGPKQAPIAFLIEVGEALVSGQQFPGVPLALDEIRKNLERRRSQ